MLVVVIALEQLVVTRMQSISVTHTQPIQLDLILMELAILVTLTQTRTTGGQQVENLKVMLQTGEYLTTQVMHLLIEMLLAIQQVFL